MMRLQQRAAEVFKLKKPSPIFTSRINRVLTPILPLRRGHPPLCRRFHSSTTLSVAVSHLNLAFRTLESHLSPPALDLRDRTLRTSNSNHPSFNTRPKVLFKRRIRWLSHTPTCRDMRRLLANTRTLPVTGKNHLRPSPEPDKGGWLEKKNLFISCSISTLFIATTQYTPSGELSGGAHFPFFFICVHLVSCSCPSILITNSVFVGIYILLYYTDFLSLSSVIKMVHLAVRKTGCVIVSSLP